MDNELRQISDAQIDILREVINIGAGSGATALAQLLQRKISMTVPGVSILSLQDVAEAIGDRDEKVVGIFLRVDGLAPGNILFILSTESAMYLVDMLLNRALGTTRTIDKFSLSALEEMGNIVAGSYLNALWSFTQLRFFPSVPSIAVDMSEAMLDSALCQAGVFGDQVLFIETKFAEQERHLAGHFLFFPDPGSLTKILSALGAAKHGECC